MAMPKKPQFTYHHHREQDERERKKCYKEDFYISARYR